MLGLHFRPFAIAQADELAPLLERWPQPLSGYTLSMLAAWNPVFRYEWCAAGEAVLASCLVEPDPNRQLLQPVGPLSPRLQNELVAAAARLPYPVRIYGVSQRFIDEYHEFCENFKIVPEPIADNYIYSVDDLALLAGRKFSAKRNHIAQATREYTWAVHELAQADAEECVALARTLLAESGGSASFARDMLACEVALRHVERLRLRGTLLRVDGRVVAFALWEALDRATAVVHFERAVRTLKGAYQVLNQETAKVMRAEGLQFVNREEDLGDEGLRKAKLSYHPLRLERCFTLTFRS